MNEGTLNTSPPNHEALVSAFAVELGAVDAVFALMRIQPKQGRQTRM